MRYRKHVRLREYDYGKANYYFVTVCTDFRKEIFVPRVSKKYGHELPEGIGPDVVAVNNRQEGRVVPISNRQRYTDIAERVLNDLEEYYENLEIDFYVFMEDHLHVIIAFHDRVVRKEPTDSRHYKKEPLDKRHYKLGDIVKIYKQVVTKQMKAAGFIDRKVFQPNYYEHVIRSEYSLDRIRRYILHNPWVEYAEIDWEMLDPDM